MGIKQKFCINCGEEIDGDDSGDWIHIDTSQHVCNLVFFADPGEGSYA